MVAERVEIDSPPQPELSSLDGQCFELLTRAKNLSDRIPWEDDGVVHTHTFGVKIGRRKLQVVVEGERNNFTVKVPDPDATVQAGIQPSLPTYYPASFQYEEGALESVAAMQQHAAVIGSTISFGPNLALNTYGYVRLYGFNGQVVEPSHAVYPNSPEGSEPLQNAFHMLDVLGKALPIK